MNDEFEDGMIRVLKTVILGATDLAIALDNRKWVKAMGHLKTLEDSIKYMRAQIKEHIASEAEES